MATSGEAKGYQCEFKEPVNQLFYCSKCCLVAREITLTACCGEGYCHTCIGDLEQNSKPCPACGQDKVVTIKPVKYTKQIKVLQVYCSMKERGCNWTGPLAELDLHVDPNQDHCKYVDTKCPLDCQKTIPKNQLDLHLTNDCPKRDSTCKHCGFKATYEEVMNVHLPECRYVPVQCPNLCGVTGERENMVDHVKTCRLEEIACEFSDLGCADKFTREEKDQHQVEKSVSHLSLLALSNREDKKIIEQYQQKIQDLEKKITDLEGKYQDMFTQYVLNLFRADNEVCHISVKQSKLLLNLERIMKKISKDDLNPSPYGDLSAMLGYRSITMEHFTIEKLRNKVCEWKTPVMYTHGSTGYSYQIGIDANGYIDARNRALSVCLWYVNMQTIDHLRWPVHITFTIELINQRGGRNIVSIKETNKWMKKNACTLQMQHFRSSCSSFEYGFVDHDKMNDYIANDSITIMISDITII